ncbi:MAG TPA: (deoxy)nucleoside triphosphate pyrophosphohydrolase [Steroidobacter sp.]|nr:(deoxy)nucleoside triphosphate pyrophosphohydrolase [Steroidobacter sp.]
MKSNSVNLEGDTATPCGSPLPSVGASITHVVAGALFDARGRVLIAQRPPGKHMEGGWEFPGGKLDPGEEPLAGLKRELREELGVEVHDAEPLIAFEHAYADRRVLLELWLVTRFTGEARPLERQPLRWVDLEMLDHIGLLEADAPMAPALREARRKDRRPDAADSEQ